MVESVARERSIAVGHAPKASADEGDVGGLDRDVGAGADGDADVGLGQRRRVVDAVADHGHGFAALLELAHARRLVRRQDLGSAPRRCRPGPRRPSPFPRGRPSASRPSVPGPSGARPRRPRPASRGPPRRAGPGASGRPRRRGESCPPRRSARSPRRRGSGRSSRLSKRRALPTRTRRVPTRPATPSPVRDSKLSTFGRSRPRSPAAATTASASGWADFFSSAAARPRSSSSPSAGDVHALGDAGLSLRERSGLVEENQGDRGGPFSRAVGVAEEDARRARPVPCPRGSRWGRQAQGAGARDDEDRGERDRREDRAGLGPQRRTRSSR